MHAVNFWLTDRVDCFDYKCSEGSLYNACTHYLKGMKPVLFFCQIWFISTYTQIIAFPLINNSATFWLAFGSYETLLIWKNVGGASILSRLKISAYSETKIHQKEVRTFLLQHMLQKILLFGGQILFFGIYVDDVNEKMWCRNIRLWVKVVHR